MQQGVDIFVGSSCSLSSYLLDTAPQVEAGPQGVLITSSLVLYARGLARDGHVVVTLYGVFTGRRSNMDVGMKSMLEDEPYIKLGVDGQRVSLVIGMEGWYGICANLDGMQKDLCPGNLALDRGIVDLVMMHGPDTWMDSPT